MARQLPPEDLPFMLGLPADVLAPITEAAAELRPHVSVNMPLALALAMWEAVGAVGLLATVPAQQRIAGEPVIIPLGRRPHEITVSPLLLSLIEASTNREG